MRIIQVYQTNPFAEGQGGGVRYVSNLLDGIKDECEQILFMGVGMQREKKSNITFLPIMNKMTGYFRFLVVLFFKLPFLDLSSYEIVHVHRLYFAIPFILLKPHLKIVCTMHGRTFSVFESNFGKWKLKLIKPIFIFIEKFSIKNIDWLVPVSSDVINSFEHKYPSFTAINQSKMSIGSPMIRFSDYNIYDENESKQYLGLDNETIYASFIGRLSDVKDLSFLIGTINNYKSFFLEKKIKLIVFGDGEDKQKLMESVNKLKLNKLIHFYGEISPTNIDKAISSSVMLLISSKHESGPIVMKEALICGIPVITNDVGEVKDYIQNGSNGYIVQKEYSQYFNAIVSLLEKKLSKETVLNNSKSGLEKCSLQYVSKQYLKAYNTVRG